MSVEILLLAVLAGIALLAYMIAINAHGPTRLGLSYLIATIILAGTVWAVVQHVNSGLDTKKVEEIKRLELEKKLAEERIRSQEEALRENKQRMGFAGKLNAIITKGTGEASTMINIDLQDRSSSLDALMARANETVKVTRETKNELEKLKVEDEFFRESVTLMKEAVDLLNEAAYYYSRYYRSEDPDQEALRERIMRQKAKAAYEKLQKASAMVASSS
jgi:hypothetical protein